MTRSILLTPTNVGQLPDPPIGQKRIYVDAASGNLSVMDQDRRIQAAVSGAGMPEPYLWAGSTTASGVGASDALQIAATSGTWTLTAGASVTAATVRFEGSQDGSVWAGICTISLTAPGSAQAPLGLQYAYTRANVVAVSGGSVSASFAPNVTPIAAPSANVGINPVLAGIPLPAPYTLAQWAVPVMLPPSGAVGSNGALTLGTALPEIYSLAASSGCWMFFPAGAVYSGSAAGVYYVIMSSTTVGTVYNTTLPYGTVPYVPSAPAAVSGTGTSYTTPTLSSFALVQIPVLGGSLGPNGILRLESDWQVNNNANIKVPGAFISPTISGAGVSSSGLLLANPGMANTVTLNLTRRVRARGRQTAVFAGFAAGAYGSSTIFGGNPVVSTGYDMTIAQNVTFTAYLATATDYMILQSADLQISYGA